MQTTGSNKATKGGKKGGRMEGRNEGGMGGWMEGKEGCGGGMKEEWRDGGLERGWVDGMKEGWRDGEGMEEG